MKDLVRRVNFFTASFVSILGFSLASEIFLENDVPDKIDDALFLILGIAAIIWYKTVGYKAGKTIGSIVFLVLAILVKVSAIIIEHDDKEAIGDDIGVTIGLVLALLFVLWQTFLRKREK